jgi:hypothetical protein
MSNVNSINVKNVSVSEAEGVQAKIEGTLESIRNMTMSLEDIVKQLIAEMQAQPELKLPKKLPKGAKEKLQKNFAEAVDNWQGRIGQLQDQLRSKYQELTQKQGELTGLQGTELPAATARDIQRAEQAQRQAEATLKQSEKHVKVETSDIRREELAAERKSQERMTRGPRQAPASGLPDRER